MMTTGIVVAYLGSNHVTISDLPTLIRTVYRGLSSVADIPAHPAEAAPLAPAVPIKKSITPDYLVCLEDGKRFKSLKRHLRAQYDMSPDQYRAKWNLPEDYPMVAPNYSVARSKIAKTLGLGQPRRKSPAEPMQAAA
nr:MucR family transcriptional regulator [Methylobacterium sp. BTF04]